MPNSFFLPLAPLTRALTSLVLVVGAYGAYVLCVVPWIEPSIGRPRGAGPRVTSERPFEPPTRPYRERLAPLFPPGSWERENAKVLKTSRAVLLMRDYQPLSDGQLRIDGCTVVYVHGEQNIDWMAAEATFGRRPPIVLRARGGAET